MRNLFIFIFILLSFSLAHGEWLNFTWDYDGPDKDTIDGFNLYEGEVIRDASGTWITDYDTDAKLTGIAPDSRNLKTNMAGEPNSIQKYCWRMTAYRGDLESAFSNEVCHKIDNLPPDAPVALTGEFDRDGNQLTIVFTQSNAGKVKYWKVFYKFPLQESFTLFGALDNTGQSSYSFTDAFDVVPAGDIQEFDFVIVSYRDERNYSENSNVLQLVVDRTGEDTDVDPVENLKIDLTIPVE